MKLDNDLVRTMLLQVEEDVDGIKNFSVDSYCVNQFPDYVPEQTIYHMKYLIDAGFIQARHNYFRDITPIGRDFLNNVRDDKVWSATKKAVKPVGTVALNIVSEVAASIVKKTFNLP